MTNGSRAVFTYNNTDLTSITEVHTDIYIDANPTIRPPETLLSGGAYLRNQNKAPIAAFTAVATSNKHMTLNGSTSSDPEGGSITYKWFDGSTQIGTGQLCDCVALGSGNRTIKLEAMDPTGIIDSATQTVKVK